MKNKYILLFLIGVILLIVGLWFSFKGRPVMHEGLVDTSLVVLGGLGSASASGTPTSVYYADTGLTNTPNWQGSTGSTYTQISGSNGYMIALGGGNVVWLGTRFDTTGNNAGFNFKWSQVANGMKYVFFDFPMLVGIDTSDRVVYIDNILTSSTVMTSRAVIGSQATKTFKKISAALGNAYAIGVDNKIWYASNLRSPTWVDVTGTIGLPLHVVYDGTYVAVIDTAFNVYYSDVIGAGTRWQLLSSQKLKHISLTNGIAVGIGPDNRVYFAPSIKDNAWVSISTSLASGTATMTQVEVFYGPSPNVRTQRISIVSNQCSEPGYTEMGADSLCYEPCPSTGYTSSLGACTGIPRTRTRAPATVVPPSRFTCSSGYDVFVSAAATCTPIVVGSVTGTAPAPLSEVYGVTGSFTLEQATAKCKTYGGGLATAAQVVAAGTAGASWSSQGWIAPTTATATTGLTQAPNATATPTSTSLAVSAMSGAVCHGVKPVSGQFTDVLPFKTGQWNQAPPCARGYNVSLTTACYKSCNPSTHTELDAMCIGRTIPKVSTEVALTEEWVCPSRHSFNGAPTTDKKTCYEDCPANYVISGTTCVPLTVNRTGSTLAIYAKQSRPQPQSCYRHCPCYKDMFGCWCPEQSICNPENCNADETLLNKQCYKKCASTETDSGSNCKPKCPADTIENPDGISCSSVCPSGSTATNKNICTYTGTTQTRKTTPSIWQTACPTGKARGIDGKCYTIGCTGLTIPGASRTVAASDAISDNTHTCKFNDVARTPSIQSNTVVTNATPPCDTNVNEYVPSTYECVSLCSANEDTAANSCTPKAKVRIGRPVTVVCNKNEEVVNGICVSKCPKGTYASGELCVSEKTVIPMPQNVSTCIATPYGNYKKWLCDKSSDTCLASCEAKKLLKDPPDGNTTYVNPNDQICVSDDPTMKMYYCQTVEEARLNNASASDTRDSYDSTCNNLSKNYIDLSGALNTIVTIREDMLYGKTTIGGARDSLQSVYNNLNCATSQLNKEICDRVLTGRNSIDGDFKSVDTALSNAITPIQKALSSRNFLRDQLYKFNCTNYTTPPAFSV